MITSAGQTVTARYKLDGTDSVNVSPGDIRVTSRASWDGKRLVIRSTSQSLEQGVEVTVETERVIWLDEAGDLVIERTGTPASAGDSVAQRLQEDALTPPPRPNDALDDRCNAY